MADIPDPVPNHFFRQKILEEYCLNLPTSDQEIVRKYCNPVSKVHVGLRDTLAGINKTEDELVREAVDKVCIGIPDKRKEKILKVLSNTFKYVDPRLPFRVDGGKPGILKPDILIPGSNCHYTKEFLLSNINSPEVTMSSNKHMSIQHIQSTSKVIEPNIDLNKYQKMKIIELVPGIIHSHKVIYATVLVDEGCTEGAYNTVIEDGYGQCVKLGINNITTQLHQSLKRGTKIAVVDPFYKLDAFDGYYFIRVDSPGEVLEIVDDESEQSKSGEDNKMEGNELFKSDNYTGAMRCYTRAIKTDKSNPIYLCNRALCYIKLDLYEEALLDSESALKMEPTNHKFLYRLAMAWSGLGDHERSVEILESTNVNKDNPDALFFLNRERILLANSRGKFDFNEIEDKLEQGEDVKIGDYIGPIAIDTSPSHGHGLFATREIQEGEILMVCKAVASVVRNLYKEKLDFGLEFHSETNEPSMIPFCYNQLIEKLTEKISNSKLTAFRVFNLYNKGLDTGPICTDLYRSKGYQLIKDKLKPPYQVEQLITIAKQNMRINYKCRQSVEPESDLRKSEHIGIWLIPSYMKSSCVSNTYSRFLRDIWVVRARLFIPKGTELTYSSTESYSEMI